MNTNYHPPLTAIEARVELGVSKKAFEELVADKSSTVKDLGGTEDFYIDHISLEKYIKKYGGKKERCREFLIELINKEKMKKLISMKSAIKTLNKRKKELEKFPNQDIEGISNLTLQDLTHDEILHYNVLIKEEKIRIKKENIELFLAKHASKSYMNSRKKISKKKLDLSDAKVFGYFRIKQFVQKAKKKYKI